MVVLSWVRRTGRDEKELLTKIDLAINLDFTRNEISSENSFINIGYGNLRADRSVSFLERVFLCYIPSFGI